MMSMFSASSADISTHALTEGDEVVPRCHMITQHFNSRPHGGRQGNTSVFHAGRHFNSRPHGGRRSSKLPHTGQKSFQLTPSRRATGRNAESGGSCNNFNSRPHGGRRFFKREINARFQFQLTPSRRATMLAGVYSAE